MLELTDDARKELDAYFGDKEKSPIRVYLASGGCSGPRLGLALDNPTDEDSTFETGGYSFSIEKELLDLVESVKIGASPMGFMVESGKPLPEGGGCGGCCSHSGGCGSGCGG